MKPIKLFIFSLLLLVVFQDSFAQAKQSWNEGPTMQNRNETFYMTLTQNNKNTMHQSEVFIQQIGNGNLVNTTVSSPNSTVHYVQNGNFNKIQTEITAKNVEHNIVQQGNRNFAYDYSYAPSANIYLDLKQTGNNLLFKRYGSNSIGNELQFKMTGNSETIIIKNFK